MSEMKPYPFCGEIVKECNDVATPIDVALRKRIAKLEAAQARWVMASERLPNKSGWYRVGAIDVFDEGYTDEVYFDANKTELGWHTCSRNVIYCWIDGVPELPKPPEVK